MFQFHGIKSSQVGLDDALFRAEVQRAFQHVMTGLHGRLMFPALEAFNVGRSPRAISGNLDCDMAEVTVTETAEEVALEHRLGIVAPYAWQVWSEQPVIWGPGDTRDEVNATYRKAYSLQEWDGSTHLSRTTYPFKARFLVFGPRQRAA